MLRKETHQKQEFDVDKPLQSKKHAKGNSKSADVSRSQLVRHKAKGIRITFSVHCCLVF